MGRFFVSMHFKDVKSKDLQSTLQKQNIVAARVTNQKGGWTSLYEDEASTQSEVAIKKLTQSLSKTYQSAAIAFLSHDSDIACYWLYESGKLIDQYDSDPNYFYGGELAEASTKKFLGKPRVLLRFCNPDVKEEWIQETLAEEAPFAEVVIERLARFLNIDPVRAQTDYLDAPPVKRAKKKASKKKVARPSAKKASPSLMMVHREEDPVVATLNKAIYKGDAKAFARLLAKKTALEGFSLFPIPEVHTMAGRNGKIKPVASMLTPLMAATLSGRLEFAKQLLSAGADPNLIHSRVGNTVHAAVVNGDVEMLKLLLAHKARFKDANARGQTPLEYLIHFSQYWGGFVIIKKMLMPDDLNFPMPADAPANAIPVAGWEACKKLLKKMKAK